MCDGMLEPIGMPDQFGGIDGESLEQPQQFELRIAVWTIEANQWCAHVAVEKFTGVGPQQYILSGHDHCSRPPLLLDGAPDLR
jgi:hypothetical protein